MTYDLRGIHFPFGKFVSFITETQAWRRLRGRSCGFSTVAVGGLLPAWLLGGKMLQWKSPLSTGVPQLSGAQYCFLTLAFKSGGDAGTLPLVFFFFFAALGLFALCWLSLVAVRSGGYSLLWCVGFLLRLLLLLQSTTSRREGFGSCNGRTQ